jgi:hypothetical protein
MNAGFGFAGRDNREHRKTIAGFLPAFILDTLFPFG